MIKLHETSLNKLSFYGICLVPITMFFSMKINSIAIILAISLGILDLFVNKNFKLLIPNRKDLLFIIYYLILIISLFFSSNFENGLKVLEYNLSFLVMPVFFYRMKKVSKGEYNLLIKLFIFGAVAVSFIFLIIASFKYTANEDISVFFYHSLSSPFDLHAVYFSIYICWALIILMQKLNKKNFRKLSSIIVFLVFILFLLSSKSIIVFAFFASIVVIYRKTQINRKVFLGTTFCLLIVFLLFSNPVKDRFNKITNFDSLTVLKDDSMTDFNKVNGLTLRLMFVKYAVLESITNPLNFIFGQGTGDKHTFLDTVYEKHNMAKTINGKKVGYYGYNAHNQYVDTLVSIGIIGLLYLLGMIFKLINLNRTNYYALSFYILLSWAFLFESILAVNKGIVFFVFWSIFFINNGYGRNNEDSNFRN